MRRFGSLKPGLAQAVRTLICFAAMAPLTALSGCGAAGSGTPPIVLSVSLSDPNVTVAAGGGPVYVPVTIDAPTETASFTIDGLPSGVTESYKESESNPSGLLTLTASASTKPGSYKPTIVVGSSGQTASFAFTLTVQAAK